MSYGLQVLDSTGAIQLDTSTRLVTLLGIKNFPMTGAHSGTFSDSNLSRGSPIYLVVEMPYGATYGENLQTIVSFSGTTCTWSVEPSMYDSGWEGTLRFYYGYY